MGEVDGIEITPVDKAEWDSVLSSFHKARRDGRGEQTLTLVAGGGRTLPSDARRDLNDGLDALAALRWDVK